MARQSLTLLARKRIRASNVFAEICLVLKSTRVPSISKKAIRILFIVILRSYSPLYTQAEHNQNMKTSCSKLIPILSCLNTSPGCIVLIMIILEPEMKYLYPATFCFSSAITNGSFKSVKCTMMEATVYNTFRKLLPSSHAGVSMNNLNSCFKDHRKGALPFFTSS